MELLEAAAYDGPVLHADGHMEGGAVGAVGLVFGKFGTRFLDARAGEEADDDGGKDDAYHTEGIGAGIAVGNGGSGIAKDFCEHTVGGTETGGIRYGSVHYAHHHRQVVLALCKDSHLAAKCPETEHDGHVEDDDTYGKQVHLHAAATLEDLEETGTYLQTDAVDKEDKAEFLDKVDDGLLVGHCTGGIGIEPVGADVADDDADEEHPCDTEGDAVLLAANLPASELHAEADDEGIENHDVGNAFRVCEKFD